MPDQLMRAHTCPDGRRIMVEGGVLDVNRRMQEGDATVGWRGDPDLYLEYDLVLDRYVVMRAASDSRGATTVMTWGFPLDERLLIHLRDHDLRRADVVKPLDALVAHETAREQATEDRLTETVGDVWAGVQWDIARRQGELASRSFVPAQPWKKDRHG